MKNNILKYKLITILLLTFTFVAWAGPIDPPADDDPVDPVPVDDWFAYLFILGLLIGIFYKIRVEMKMLKE